MECGLEATPTARLQTPPGRGGIAVICVEGPGAAAVLEGVFEPLKSHRRGGEGVLQLGHLVAEGRVIDEAVVASRGLAIEINIHGGPAVARAAMELLAKHGAKIAPATSAAAGSFALAHASWDNPAIGGEMLEALPQARCDLALAALTQQWSGGLSRLVHRTAGRIQAGMSRQDSSAAAELHQAAARLARMNRVLNPPEVVLAGPPNVGKSTLANALVGRPVSIVHHAPGTTRDWVRELAVLGGSRSRYIGTRKPLHGVAVWLTDTAGLWDQAAGIDAEASRRAHNRAESADLVLLLHAAGSAEPDPPISAGRLLRVASKCDIRPPARECDLAVSALTGLGLDRLRLAILEALDLADIDPAAPMAFTHRQASLLKSAAAEMEQDRLDCAREMLLDILR